MMPRNLVNVPVLVVDAWPVLEWFYKRSPVVNLFTNEPHAKLWMERNQFGQAQVQALKGRDIVQPEMLAIPMDRSADATNFAKSSNLSLHWLGI